MHQRCSTLAAYPVELPIHTTPSHYPFVLPVQLPVLHEAVPQWSDSKWDSGTEHMTILPEQPIYTLLPTLTLTHQVAFLLQQLL